MKEIRNQQGELLDTFLHPGTRESVLVVLGHGVTGNKDRPLLVAVAEGLSARGWPCLRISYAGNGASDGRFEDTTISKEVADLSAVIDAVPEGTRVIYCGHSMGGAVGTLTTAKDSRIVALVSLAAMVHTSAFCDREFGEVTPGEGFMWDDPACPLSKAYVEDMHQIGSTLSAAKQIRVPWLLIHGEADDVVPASDSADAFEAARDPKRLVVLSGAEHSFDEQTYGTVVDEIDLWLLTHLGS